MLGIDEDLCKQDHLIHRLTPFLWFLLSVFNPHSYFLLTCIGCFAIYQLQFLQHSLYTRFTLHHENSLCQSYVNPKGGGRFTCKTPQGCEKLRPLAVRRHHQLLKTFPCHCRRLKMIMDLLIATGFVKEKIPPELNVEIDSTPQCQFEDTKFCWHDHGYTCGRSIGL